MPLTKKQIIDTINAMPEEEFKDIDVLLERMIVLEKVDKAEQNIVDEKTYTTEEAKQKLSKWFR